MTTNSFNCSLNFSKIKCSMFNISYIFNSFRPVEKRISALECRHKTVVVLIISLLSNDNANKYIEQFAHLLFRNIQIWIETIINRSVCCWNNLLMFSSLNFVIVFIILFEMENMRNVDIKSTMVHILWSIQNCFDNRCKTGCHRPLFNQFLAVSICQEVA